MPDDKAFNIEATSSKKACHPVKYSGLILYQSNYGVLRRGHVASSFLGSSITSDKAAPGGTIG